MLPNSPLQTLHHPLFIQHKVQVKIKRDDLIHPQISGNKWRKLKFTLQQVKKNNFAGIVSFGGAYSNHIHALAYAGKHYNIPTSAIIRGEESYANNATLSQAQDWGMKLTFVDRKTYKKRDEPEYLSLLQNQYPNHLIVPEGGSNKLALQGVAEVITELNQQTEFDYLLCPVGSGGTIAGLITGATAKQHILGIAVLKNAEYLCETIRQLLPEDCKHKKQWQLLTDFHRGGYAKFNKPDIERITSFIKQSNIPFEPIYSGKMLLALFDLLAQNKFPANSRIVLLHTGGLQGLQGLAEQNKVHLNEWQTS
jgi:1-aminocyclopropane-1-carboxylate deaminase